MPYHLLKYFELEEYNVSKKFNKKIDNNIGHSVNWEVDSVQS